MNWVLEAVAEALEEGRQALSRALRLEHRPIARGAYGDLSFNFDVEAEKAVVEVLRKRFENSLIASEETGIIGESRKPDYYILVDPVDGSKNALRGVPFYSTSIVVADGPKLSNVLAAGLIDHSSGEIYLGERGGEVSAAGTSPRLSEVRSLKEAYIFLDHGSFNHLESRRWAERLSEEALSTRFIGSAILEIAYILRGRADGFACLSKTLKLMDFLAPAFLLKLSGGYYNILDIDKDLEILTRERFGVVAASTRELLDEIMALKE